MHVGFCQLISVEACNVDAFYECESCLESYLLPCKFKTVHVDNNDDIKFIVFLKATGAEMEPKKIIQVGNLV